MYLNYNAIQDSRNNGYDRYSFYWGYDIEKMSQQEFMTFAEATQKWGLSESTLRMAVKRGTLEEGKDYRKSGKVWLITREAMKKNMVMKNNNT